MEMWQLLFSTPPPPKEKKNDTIWSGGGVCLPCHTGVNQKLVTLGFSNASHLTSLRVCFCFIFVGKMKNDFFCFYSSRASSQFINIIKYTVVLICGMVREKGKKWHCLTLTCYVENWSTDFFLSGLLAFWKYTLSLCILLYRIRSYLLKNVEFWKELERGCFWIKQA